MKMFWFKFDTAAWLQDAALRRCTHAQKGVWIDMICLMYQCEERGVLSTSGKAWSDEEIARAIGGDQGVTLSCIRELIALGVAHRNASDAVYSKRVIRDEERRAKSSSNGAKGGNPSLKGLSQPSDTLNSGSSVLSSSFPERRAPEVLPPQSEWLSPSDTRKPGWKSFYSEYPQAERQVTLFHLWDQMGLEPIAEEILLGLRLWKASERWKTGHVMGMRRFMDDRKWNDAPPPSKNPKAPATTKREEGTSW